MEPKASGTNSVLSVYKGHLREPVKITLIGKWTLFTGSDNIYFDCVTRFWHIRSTTL